jgi:hypothetical protein
MESYVICLFVIGLFHHAHCPEVLPMAYHVPEFPSFLGCSILCLHLLVHIYLSVDERLSYFYDLAVVTNGAKNMSV